MKVKVAETAGFCFGVKRAVDKVYELIDTEQKPIFTLGPIIHNEGVVADLEARGIVREKAVWQKQKLKRRMREQQKSFWMLTMTQ